MASISAPPAGGFRTDYNTYGTRGSGARSGVPYPHTATYTPDYQSILDNDPAYMALKQSISAQGIQDATQRRGATNQALVQFGQLPDFSQLSGMGLSADQLKMLQGDIDPATGGLATNNPNSTEHLLQQHEDQAMLALRNQLASRGAISSGDNAYRSGQQEQAYGKAQQDALTQLLGALTGYQQNYLTQQGTEQGQLAQGLSQAEATDSGLPQYQGAVLNYNAHSGKYVGPSGETYTPTYTGHGWKLTADGGTGLSYILNPDGSLSLG